MGRECDGKHRALAQGSCPSVGTPPAGGVGFVYCIHMLCHFKTDLAKTAANIYIVNIASQLYNLLRQLRGGKKRVASKCLQYTHIIPRSKWEMPPKVDENDQANILLNFQIQTDKLVMANQLDIVVVDK